MEFEKLKEIIAGVLNVDRDEITYDTTFVNDLGADSLDMCQIIMEIEKVFAIRLEPENIAAIVSAEDAVREIKDVIG